MKVGTLVHHLHGYKTVCQISKFLPGDLVMVLQSQKQEAQWPIGYGVGLRIKRSSV